MKNLLLGISMCVLTGCFLTPESKTQTQTGKAINGLVEMVDIQGWLPKVDTRVKSYVSARFGYPSQVQKVGQLAARGNYASSRRDAKAGLQCDVARGTLSGRDRAAAAATSYVSVGKMTFNGAAVEERADHSYRSEIAPDFPSGIFSIKAEGNAERAGFSEAISMPEAIRGAKVDGANMEVEGPMFSRTQSLKFEWDEPRSQNDNNYIALSILSIKGNDAVQVVCQILEKELWTAQGATLSLEVPQSYVGQLLKSDDVEIDFERVHEFGPSSSALAAGRIDGVRIVATKGIIED